MSDHSDANPESAPPPERRGRPGPATATLLGCNANMREVSELISRVADTDVTVLVRGESGTGKELVARAIHAASPRRNRTFVKVNCAALPSELLESELFGFERGAFTGAIQHKPGKFEFANHGTMFLDEISEMQPPLQSKLLQVLQDGEFARLGGREDVRVDVRVVAATNRNLEQAVADGQFREDLYFRLNVVCIAVPPLRQRREEIPTLTQLFLHQYSEHYNRPAFPLAADIMRLFSEHDWPGNVRELENAIERAVVVGKTRQIIPSDLPILCRAPMTPSNAVTLEEIEKAHIRKILDEQQWNIARSARVMGIDRSTLYSKIKRYALQKTA
jgi:transcriptional regulator with PAS, ATPase and Fis domain